MNKKQTKYLQVSILLRNFAAKHKADRGQVRDITKVTRDWSVTLETQFRRIYRSGYPQLGEGKKQNSSRHNRQVGKRRANTCGFG